MSYSIYADIESLIKTNKWVCKQSRKFFYNKKEEYISCGYSMPPIWSFDNIEIKHTLYRGKGCMSKFSESLKEHVKNIMDFEKKKMLPLTKEKLKSNQYAKVHYICEKRILKGLSNSISYRRVKDHCHYTGKYRGVAHSICNLKFNAPNENTVVFLNCSTYDYHFL